MLIDCEGLIGQGTYVGYGSSVDAGDHDRSVAPHAEPEALVVQFAQVSQARRVPLVLCREQSERTQCAEQILDRMLLKVRLSERQLQLRRRCVHTKNTPLNA